MFARRSSAYYQEAVVHAPLRALALRELDRYLARYPAEAPSLVGLRAQLLDGFADPFARSNMRGHVTTSAFVLNAAFTHALLIHHNFFDKWMQPGGHYELEEKALAPGAFSLWNSAYREVLEETGIVCAFRDPALGPPTPMDIETHAMGANPAKGEGAHVHHDFVYLMVAQGNFAPTALLTEVKAARWVPLSNVLQLGEMQRMARKAVDLLSLST